MGKLREIYKKYVIGDIKNTEEEPDVEEWERFLASLPKPKDVFEEAHNKYLCRLTYMPENKVRLLNAAAFFVLAANLPGLMTEKEPLPKAGVKKLFLEKRDVDYADVIPPEIPLEYPDMAEEGETAASFRNISKEALRLYKETVRRYPTEFYFHLYVLKELAKHSCYIKKYNPSATAVYVNERNAAGPILTYLYEKSGRKLISFMHGEYLLQMIQAYMNFSEFYVWDPMYIPMFRDDLRCNIRKYIVTTPKKLTKKWHLENVTPDIYCTYYFSGESTASVRKIAEIFRKMDSEGKRVLVRPHPRYSHLELIAECFDPSMIEDPGTVTMEESLGRTRYAAGMHTTVLSEALVEGRMPVIDDMSDPAQFANLEKRKFVMLEREHKLLSEIV